MPPGGLVIFSPIFHDVAFYLIFFHFFIPSLYLYSFFYSRLSSRDDKGAETRPPFLFVILLSPSLSSPSPFDFLSTRPLTLFPTSFPPSFSRFHLFLIISSISRHDIFPLDPANHTYVPLPASGHVRISRKTKM